VRAESTGRSLGKTRVVAPIDGEIETQVVAIGDYVKVGDPLFALVGMSRLRAHLLFPESAANRIRPGLKVALESPAAPGRTIETRIDEIKPTVNAGNRALDAIVRFDSDDGAFRGGGSVNARVVIDVKENALMVPEQSVVLRPAGKVVYVLNEGRVAQRQVETGLKQDGWQEIVKGLAPGEMIAADGAAELRALAELTRIPVTTTLMALGAFPSDHPLSLGMLGMHGGYAPNMAVYNSDCLIAVGARFDDRVTGLSIEKLLPRDLTLADVGCGTGSLTFELARFARKVIGVDLSREMLRRARAIAKERKLGNVEFRQGDALEVPLPSRSVDAAFCVMVLHFVPDPARAIANLCRITRLGGPIILVDLVQHKQDWMREQMAHQWLGFDRPAIERWFRQAGANAVDYELTGSFAGEKLARNGNRPVEIFVARATLPAKAKRKKAS